MELLPVSLLGGLLALDTTAVLQILISQPLVAGTILGWVLGDVQLGMQMGLLLQLLWLNQLPVGAAKIPQGNLASIIAVILIFRLDMFLDSYLNILLLLVILYTLLVSHLGIKLMTTIRNWNIRLLNRAIGCLDNGRISALGRINILALLLHFVTVAGAIYISVFLGQFVFKYLIPVIPMEWDTYARYIEIAVIGSGIGLTLNLYKEKKNLKFLALGAALGILIVVI